jgi:MoxR-like ATPase
MVLGAKARAVLQGRHYAGQEDIRAVAAPVLRHRIKTNFNADAEGITPDDLVRRLAETIPPVKEDDKAAAKVPEVFKASS